MDSGSAIIGAILLAICIVPFVLMHIGRSRREKKMIQALHTLARQHNSSMSEHELCGDFAIGIDKTNKKLFFLKGTNNNQKPAVINLSEIEKFKIDSLSGITKNASENAAWTKQIDFCFIPFSSKNELRLELYREELNEQLTGELELAEKWSKMIQEQLTIRKKMAV